MRTLYVAAFGLAIAASTSARADLISHRDLSLAMAVAMATTASETCKTNGYRVSVTVVGREGQIIVQMRGDEASPHTMENSLRKAYTARTFRTPSGEIAKRVKENPTLSFPFLTNVGAAQGALPIKVGEDTIGAIGTSGAPGGDKDEVCSKAGLDKVADQLK